MPRPQGGGSDIGAYEYRNTWDGSEGTDWATAGNWSLNTVPSTTSAYNAPLIANVDNAPIFKDKFYLKENDLELQIGTVKTFNESKNNINKYHFKVFIDLMRERL